MVDTVSQRAAIRARIPKVTRDGARAWLDNLRQGKLDRQPIPDEEKLLQRRIDSEGGS